MAPGKNCMVLFLYIIPLFSHTPKIKGGGGGVTKESCLSTKTSAEIASLSSKRKKEGTKEGRKNKKRERS